MTLVSICEFVGGPAAELCFFLLCKNQAKNIGMVVKSLFVGDFVF